MEPAPLPFACLDPSDAILVAAQCARVEQHQVDEQAIKAHCRELYSHLVQVFVHGKHDDDDLRAKIVRLLCLLTVVPPDMERSETLMWAHVHHFLPSIVALVSASVTPFASTNEIALLSLRTHLFRVRRIARIALDAREAHDVYQRVLCELSASVLDVAKVAYQSGALPCTEASEDVLTALRDVVGACEEAKTALCGSSVVSSELVDRLLSQLRIE